MIVIQAAAETGIIDLIIGIGGSLLVAVVSVSTIVLSNRNARRLKTDDYRREELEAVADAVESARATIEQIASVQYLLRSLQKYEIASQERDASEKRVKASIAKSIELRKTMEKNLLRVSITNPHQTVRGTATLVDDAVTITYDQGLTHWENQYGSTTFHNTVDELVDFTKGSFKTFRSTIYQIYHNEKYTNRAIRKSDTTERDKKIWAARIALDKLKKKHPPKTNGKTQ